MDDKPYWQHDDLVARLRMESSINQGHANLCGDAADEIERMRLTDADQKALDRAIFWLTNSSGARVGVALDNTLAAQKLRKILEQRYVAPPEVK